LPQARETRPGWSDEKTAMPNHQRDRFIDTAVKEPNTKNLLSRDHQMNIEPACGRRGDLWRGHPTSNIERRISNLIALRALRLRLT
jgi:hypothetical protein